MSASRFLICMAFVVVLVLLGAAVVFIAWGSVFSVQRRLRMRRPSSGPDYESFAGFYRSNPLRRGDDVALGHVDDQGYRWELSWLPQTREVIALCSGWADERTHLRTGGVFGAALLSATPELVHVLGTAATADDARRRVAGCGALDDIRNALFAAAH